MPGLDEHWKVVLVGKFLPTSKARHDAKFEEPGKQQTVEGLRAGAKRGSTCRRAIALDDMKTHPARPGLNEV